MWAAGLVDLGLTATQFWELTPRQFHVLLERRKARDCFEREGIAILSAITANIHRDKDKKPSPYTTQDFLPGAQHEPLQGPGPMAPCPECEIPRWKGHLADCSYGQRHFKAQVAELRKRDDEAKEKLARHG